MASTATSSASAFEWLKVGIDATLQGGFEIELNEQRLLGPRLRTDRQFVCEATLIHGTGQHARRELVVAKVLQANAHRPWPTDHDSSTAPRYFFRECDIMRMIQQSPHASRFSHLGAYEWRKGPSRSINRLVLCIQKLPGPDLRKWIRARSRRPTLQQRPVFRGIFGRTCLAVAALHQLDTYHGDIKPDNFVVQEPSKGSALIWNVRAIDQGASVRRADPFHHEDCLSGTYSPAAPEVRAAFTNRRSGWLKYLLEIEHQDWSVICRADVWSLGMIYIDFICAELQAQGFAPPGVGAQSWQPFMGSSYRAFDHRPSVTGHVMLTLGRHQVELSFILGLARRLYPDGSMQPILICILWRTMEYHPIARLSSASLAHIWLAASGELGDHPQVPFYAEDQIDFRSSEFYDLSAADIKRLGDNFFEWAHHYLPYAHAFLPAHLYRALEHPTPLYAIVDGVDREGRRGRSYEWLPASGVDNLGYGTAPSSTPVLPPTPSVRQLLHRTWLGALPTVSHPSHADMTSNSAMRPLSSEFQTMADRRTAHDLSHPQYGFPPAMPSQQNAHSSHYAQQPVQPQLQRRATPSNPYPPGPSRPTGQIQHGGQQWQG